MIKSRKKTSGGHAAVQSLKKEKVEHVFGLIGSATMEMFDALYHEKKIKFIGVRDERTGTHMADGYARASNKPGVIIAGQNGPGATNLVTGVAQAKAAFSPVVAIAGSYSTKDKMEDAFQGLDQQSLFTPITKKTWTVKNSKIIPKVISDAFSLAMKPRRGPVCVNLPRNILAAAKIFLGKLTHTGPLRGFIARLKASLITFGIIFEFLTVQVFLVMGVNKDC